MIFWIACVGEPLPVDPESPRLYRAGQLAERLVQRGHKVVYWAATLNHAKKTFRAAENRKIRVRENYDLILLHGRGYQKNVSLRRVLHSYDVAKNFSDLASNLNHRPDLILCAYPTIELSDACVRFGRSHNIPIILDVRDLWPDIFEDYLPKPAALLFRPVRSYFDRTARQAFSGATAITGISNGFVNWALNKGHRKSTKLDKHFFHAYLPYEPSGEEKRAAEEYLNKAGVSNSPDGFLVAYIGNLSFDTELACSIDAVRMIPWEIAKNFQLVICGLGEALDSLKRQASDLPNVIFPGWLNKAQISVLMNRASIGVVPYLSTKNFRAAIPNKVGEYLSAGLPIISTIQGNLAEFLEENKCGVTVPNNSPKQFASAIVALYKSGEERNNMSRRASNVFHQHFDADKVYNDYCKHIEELARNRILRDGGTET